MWCVQPKSVVCWFSGVFFPKNPSQLDLSFQIYDHCVNWELLLALSQNQYSRQTTNLAWSHHIQKHRPAKMNQTLIEVVSMTCHTCMQNMQKICISPFPWNGAIKAPFKTSLQWVVLFIIFFSSSTQNALQLMSALLQSSIAEVCTETTTNQRCSLPHQVKMQYLHFRFHASYFLLPWKIPEEIHRQSMLFHN